MESSTPPKDNHSARPNDETTPASQNEIGEQDDETLPKRADQPSTGTADSESDVSGEKEIDTADEDIEDANGEGEQAVASEDTASEGTASKETAVQDLSSGDTLPADTTTEDATAEEGAEEDYTDIEIQARLLRAAEAMIFAADEPVPPHRIAEIFAEVTGRMQPDLATVETHVRALNQEYQSTGRTLVIHEWAGGYRMTTRSDLSPFVKALVVGEQETSLSRSLLETLAVLAYRQPVTRPEVDFVRGVNSDYAIRKLLDLGLADVKGRSESLGRPLLYGTTDRFLEQFGLNTLEDLPTLREIQDLLDDPNFDEERSQLLQLDTEEEITDRETAKEVLSEAREKVQSGEIDADDIMDSADAERAEEAEGGAEAEEPGDDNVDVDASATTGDE
jgi:segregation and condensation protein B